MALDTPVTPDNMTRLYSASEAKSISSHMELYHEMAQIAAVINHAVNTGAYKCLYNHTISDDARSQLESKGYVLSEPKNLAIPKSQTIISWA